MTNHRRSDGKRGSGEQLEHSLGEDVGGRVADREEATLRCRGDYFHLVTVDEFPPEVTFGSVDRADHGCFGETSSDGGGQPSDGGALGHRSLGTVGQLDRDVGHWASVGEALRTSEPDRPGRVRRLDVQVG